MRMLSRNEIGFVSGGSEPLETVDVIASRISGPRGSSQQWAPLSAMSREQLMGQQAGLYPVIAAFVLGLFVNYAYDKAGGAEGVDQALEDLEKWVDEKAKELSAATGMAIDDAKCLLRTAGSSGPGGGAPMTCSMTGANGSW